MIFRVLQGLLLCLVLTPATCQSSSSTSQRVFGIGVGTLVVIIAIIFAILWCLVCRSSSRPELYSMLGVIAPLVLILAFVLTPKESQRTSTSTATDSNFIPHIVFMVLSVVGFLACAALMLVNESFVYRKAKSIARSAFVTRDEKEEADRQDEQQPLRESQVISQHTSEQLIEDP